MAIYMKIDGIPGTATEAHHEGWCVMEECNFTVQREVNTDQGNVVDRSNKAPHFDDLELKKYSDKASPLLMKWMITGQTHDVVIHFCKESGEEYMVYDLKKVLLSEYTIEGAEDDRPKDSLKIDYAQIDFIYRSYDSTNENFEEQKAGYDLIAGEPTS